MVTSYWSIGQLIVEDEQNGNERAEYGKAVLEGLSKKLTAEFGKGFDESNLRYMRLFYQTFKNCVFFLVFMPQIPTASCYQPVHSIKERLIFITFNSKMVKLFN